ncbi:MAG: hypothetical protein ACKN9V_03755 [Pseudomonadota bacterium]
MSFLLTNLQFFFAAFNFGAILFVQWVHYPLFRNVGEDSFVRYHQLHVSRTTLLLGTSLFCEMLLNLWLAQPIPLILLSIGWIATFLVSVPQHGQLEKGFLEQAHRTLLFSNLVRSIAWGALTVYLIFRSTL